jgi:hypothetical protein
MKIQAIILTLFLFGCGVETGSVEKQFIPHIVKFSNITGRVVDVTMRFSELKDDYVGMCTIYKSGRRVVEIDESFWNESDYNEREELIFHELGHCVLNRRHSETMATHPEYNYKFPNSIMYPYVFGHRSFYERFKEHYYQELINPEKLLDE